MLSANAIRHPLLQPLRYGPDCNGKSELHSGKYDVFVCVRLVKSKRLHHENETREAKVTYFLEGSIVTRQITRAYMYKLQFTWPVTSCYLRSVSCRRTRQQGGVQRLLQKFRKPWKFGKSQNMSNSGHFITIFHKNSGKI